MIRGVQNATLTPSEIVHRVAYTPVGFQLLCDAPWVVATSTYQARVATEGDPVGRTMVLDLTRDPVDCMSCLVVHGRRWSGF